ncbi:MAG: DUF4126 domain-containing protein, partial [Arenibacter sp.]|nr:DUF4126 domain-containing protein [Arenibacter sp.]
GGTATAIKSTSATGRVASSATTGGLANPIIGVVETVAAGIMTILAIFVPILAVGLTVLILFFLLKLYKRLKPKSN